MSGKIYLAHLLMGLLINGFVSPVTNTITEHQVRLDVTSMGRNPIAISFDRLHETSVNQFAGLENFSSNLISGGKIYLSPM